MRSGCKKYLALQSSRDGERANAILCLQSWCIAAVAYDRQRDHLQHALPPISSPPSQAVIMAGFIRDRPAEPAKTDMELDMEGAWGASNEKGVLLDEFQDKIWRTAMLSDISVK